MMCLCRRTLTKTTDRNTPKWAFTLVELLVVIAIIGVLVALLLPAVQAARESARRTQCISQLKQWGLGSINSHDVSGHYPTGGWGWAWLGDADRGFGKDQPGGWIYNLLPYVEMGNLHAIPGDGEPDVITPQQREAAKILVEMPITIFQCPSRRTATNHSVSSGLAALLRNSDAPDAVARADYAMNSGTYWPEFDSGPTTLTGSRYDNYKWMITRKPAEELNGVAYQASEVSIAQVTDGTSNTLLIGEKSHLPSAYEDGSWPADNETWGTGFNNDNYRIMQGDPSRQDSIRTSLKEPLSDSAAEALYERYRRNDGTSKIAQRFGSAHSSIWNATFCDGSVHSLSYDVDPFILQYMADRFDGNVVDSTEL